MPAGVQGLRGTGEFDADHRPKNYRELYTLLEPNGSAPLNALLSMMGTQATDDPEFKHFRDELPDRTLTVNNGAGYNTSATSIAVDAATEIAFFTSGTLVQNTATGEVMQIDTDASASPLTVTRNIGSTSYSITDNDILVAIGYADKEGDTSPTPIAWDATVASNYTQIFKTPVSISGTMQNTNLRTGSKEQELLTKALKLHMSDLERSMFFGIKAEVNGSTAQPTRYTGGLTTQITNVTDAASAFTTANQVTEKEFDRWLVETAFSKGSKERVCFVGATVAANLMEIAKNRWTPTSVDGSYGVSMTKYATFAGDLMVHLHPMFRQVPGMADAMIMLDMPYLSYRCMKNRDTQLQRDIHTADFDGVKHQYLTECGLEMTQAQVHTYLKNWQTVS